MRGHFWGVLNVAFLVLIAALLARPEGPIGSRISEWRARRDQARLIKVEWPKVVDGGSAYSGDPTLPAEVVVFTDYECPYCRKLHSTLELIRARRPEVRIRYRHFPLSTHKNAAAAARASVCAAKVGAFHEVHGFLFESESWRTTSGLEDIAGPAGIVDVKGFANCMSDPSSEAVVRADIATGERLGINGTPAIVTRDRLVIGALDESDFLALLE